MKRASSRAALLAARLAGTTTAAPPPSPPGRRSVSPTKRGSVAPESGWEDIVEGARHSIVKVVVLAATYDMRRPSVDPRVQGFAGTGFFFRNNLVDATGVCKYAEDCKAKLRVDLERYPDILTNAHVVNNAIKVAVQLDAYGERNFSASVVCFYQDLDIAVLRLDTDARRALAMLRLGKEAALEYRRLAGARGPMTETTRNRLAALLETAPPLPVLEFDESEGVRQAAPVLTIGHPLGVAPIMTTEGIFSGFTAPQKDGYVKMQISAATNHGNSGGPLLDAAGRVIGITSSGIPDAENTAFAIPTEQIRAALSGLHADEQCYALRHPRLGAAVAHATEGLMEMRGIAADDVESGLHVARLYPNSLLARAGVQEDDIIVKFDDFPIDAYGNIVYPSASVASSTAVNDGARRIAYSHHLALKHMNAPLGVTFYRGGKRGSEKAARRGGVTPWVFSRPMPIDRVFPTIDEAARDYVSINGIVLVPVSLNLVDTLLEACNLKGARRAGIEQFHDPLNRVRPRVAISYIDVASQNMLSSSVLAPGMLVSSINDTEIGTIEDVRAALVDAIRASPERRFFSLRTDEHTLAVYRVGADGDGNAAAKRAQSAAAASVWCVPGTWSDGVT